MSSTYYLWARLCVLCGLYFFSYGEKKKILPTIGKAFQENCENFSSFLCFNLEKPIRPNISSEKHFHNPILLRKTLAE